MSKRTELIHSSKRRLLEGGAVAESFAAFALPDDQSKFILARVRMKTDGTGQPNVTLFTLAANGEFREYDAPIQFEQLVTGQAPRNYPLIDAAVIDQYIKPDREAH